MIEILLTACLLTGGNDCKDFRLTFEDEGQLITPYACMVIAQVEIAKWMEAHPKYAIKRWKCLRAGSEADL